MRKKIINLVNFIALPVLLFVIFSIAAEGFGFHSIPVIISQSMIPAVLGFGLSLLMMAELMDFSIGARSVFAAVIGGILAKHYGIPGLIIGCFIGALIGALVMGAIYYFLRIPAMVVSLGIVMIYEVLGAKITGTSGYLKISPDQYVIASYPYNILIMCLAAVIFYIIVYRTKIGCHITAVGNDEYMCRNVGIKADRVKLQTFILSGIFCGFAGLLIICYSGSISSSTDMSSISMVFKPIMCVLIGRQMRRYIDNMPLLILLGGISLTIVFNGFIALGLPDASQDIVLGVFLIALIGYSTNSASFNEWKRRRAIKKQAGI